MVEQTKKRTLKQNASLHVYFQELANLLNESGLDISKTLRHDIEIPWNSTTVKELIWKRVQNAQLGKKSTTELTTKEIDQVFDTINRYLATRHGLHIPFPSIEAFIDRPEL
jgi:DNA phosphorothioation-dependent restriction protein DptG